MFFFSSRRRHTRYWRDWSSDVCSSDLLQDRDHQAMILALRQAGNGNGADAPGSFEHDGKTSAVGRVVAQIQTGSRLQSAVGAFVFQPYGVGAAVVARNHVAFPANPFPIVRSGY